MEAALDVSSIFVSGLKSCNKTSFWCQTNFGDSWWIKLIFLTLIVAFVKQITVGTTFHILQPTMLRRLHSDDYVPIYTTLP